MEKTEKAEVVSVIKDLLSQSNGVFLVNYNGVDVEDINKLRGEFRKENVTYKVFKNTLFKRAIEESGGYEEFKNRLEGMIGVGFTGENYIAPAKIIKNYYKKKENFTFKGCYVESEFFDENKLDVLASLPSKPEIISSIMTSISSPVSGIVGSIGAVMRDLVSLVDEVSKKKAS
jgi:large subunit ribosomal protein L10